MKVLRISRYQVLGAATETRRRLNPILEVSEGQPKGPLKIRGGDRYDGQELQEIGDRGCRDRATTLLFHDIVDRGYGVPGNATLSHPLLNCGEQGRGIRGPRLPIQHDVQNKPGTLWTAISGWWLAVEVSGRASRVYDRDFKRDAYLALGVKEVWLVDLQDHRVLVSSRGAQPDAPHEDELIWHPSEMPAPLTIDLRNLFAGLD
jgi:hypothetical protein